MARNEELTANLLTHFRSTVETRVKEVQKRVERTGVIAQQINACNNRKKMVLENNITPFQDFSSRLLAYAIAGLTLFGSVLVCMEEQVQ